MNAVEERLERIGEAWLAFTDDPEARIGRWRLDGDEIGLVETFMEAQTMEGSAVEDFFLRLDVPFADPAAHGLRLREAFIQEIEAAADEMAEAGVERWRPPPLGPQVDDVAELLALMHAFATTYRSLFPRVILVLLPGELPAGPDAWRWWVSRLAERPIPEHLRFMLFDPTAAPLLDGVASASPSTVMTLAPDLDPAGMLEQLARDVGGTGPGDLFRRYFVGMSTAAQRGDLQAALRMGDSAAELAKRQGWPQQVAVVHMAMGSLLLGSGQLKKALAAFGASRAAATASRDAGDAGSDVVVLQARLAEAGALFKAEAFPEAAQAYEDVVAIAREHGPEDPLLMLESRRMAAICYERMNRADGALHHLRAALVEAENIEPDQRLDTTLPYVVRSAWQLTAGPPHDGHRPEVAARIEELLGPEWPARVQEKLPA
ncbi:MAG: tetratricopeptide repeat protein [Gemmatimonadetes bacterium]|nr:tetratricopeptide repeat protein [Gemmatimonadota bacterium]